MSTPSSQDLLSPHLLARLEKLSLASRRRLRGDVLGSRKSVRHGASVEFTDYRDYLPGDDLRYVDWKAYARLDKLLVRLFNDEDDLSLHLLIDTSASMRYGESISKFLFAQQLCAALGAIALSNFDRCSLFAVGQSSSKGAITLRGRTAVGELVYALKRLKAAGESNLSRSLLAYASARNAPGTLVIVSDFYDHNLQPALLARVAKKHTIVFAHIVDPDEIDPSQSLGVDGDEVRLIDSETGEYIELTLSPAVLADYQSRFNKFCSELSELAKGCGASYIRISTDTPIEDVVFGSLREKRVVG